MESALELTKNKRMTSLETAEITGKRHTDVLETIRKMKPAWVKATERYFPLSEYKAKTRKQ